MRATAGLATTPDTVQTSLGALEFRDRAPTPDEAERLYGHQGVIRGVDAFLNRSDRASIHAIRRNARLRAYGRGIW